ncbi:MAG: PIN domain-containing protein [Acidobacteria bacterium]|nr:PIN domain-containing protein [Acidobacteriota bacterium]
MPTVLVVDTSLWIDVLRDADKRGALEAAIGGDDVYLTRFTQVELLASATREEHWHRLATYLDGQRYLEPESDTWRQAARTFFELQRLGTPAHNPTTCCIAEIAVAHKALLLHHDQDFGLIAALRPLQERWIEL